MKKSIVSLLLVVLIISSLNVNVYAQEIKSEDKLKEKTSHRLSEKEKYYQELIEEMLTEDEIAFIKNIETIKAESPELTTEEIVEQVFGSEKKDTTYSLEESINATKLEVESTKTGTISDLLDTYDNVFDSLTPSEQYLVTLFPQEALGAYAAKKKADQLTIDRYGSMVDGDEANAFRHAIWNALMSDDIGKTYAKSFADAHEAVADPQTGVELTDQQLASYSDDYGNTYLEHKNMDLHNNEMGRDCSHWYDVYVSATTLANRVADKIDNGEMIILVN